MDVLGRGWEVMLPAGSGADLAACWRRWVEDALGGKLLALVLCAVVASLAPFLQSEPLSSTFLTPPHPSPAPRNTGYARIAWYLALVSSLLECCLALLHRGLRPYEC